jgi:hypothetical protein
VVLALAALLVLVAPARAQSGTVTIGLYAPTAPFDGTSDRVAFVSELADHLAGAAGAAKVTGKVYASASAFAKAIKNKDIQYAVVDAPYAAALGLPWKPLGAAVRGGRSTIAWQLVAGPGVASLSDLEGKKVVVPATGARPQAFVTQVLLEGEVEAGYFAKILEAPDAKSALTMVSVGKAEAALVPGGIDLPSGISKVTTLATVGWPMFVALPGADDARTRALLDGLASFSSGGAFGGFAGAEDGRYPDLTGRFSRGTKKGPMAVPAPARLGVKEILEGRSFSIPLSNVLDLIELPAKASARARK